MEHAGRTTVETPVLTTDRLVLRPYTPADEEAFVALFQDQEVARYVGDGPATEAEDRALFGRVFTLVYPTGKFAVWAVERDGHVVGHAELKPSPTDDIDGWELVYVLARAEWGMGLGSELARAVTRYGCDVLGLDRVYATVDADNTRSLQLLARLGYREVGVRHEEQAVVRVLAYDEPGGA